MTKAKRILTTILLLALVLTIGGELFLAFSVRASAASSPSGVLDDLTAANNFKIENYPNLTHEYIKTINSDANTENDQALMEVIQIAESTSGELYLYVYQPTDSELDLTATAILLSTEFTPDGQNINPDIYYLELVSTDSVFDKYVVKDFRVSEEPYRYYNIVTLYRNFHPDIDEVTAGGVIENFELGIGVGQQWCAYYMNNGIVYEMNTFDTVEIDIGYTGSVSFGSGFKFNNILGAFEFGDAWFIAFNVEDYIVDKIFNADLRYKIRSKENVFGVGINETTYGEWSGDIPVTLASEDIAIYEGDGLLAKKYIWNKIAKSVDFIAQLEKQNIKISDEARTHLSENEWVFAFLQTERKTNTYGYTQSTYSSEVSAVTVIRLHFMDIKGDVYNLGVVSDRVSPDDIPDALGSGTDTEWFDKIMAALMFIIICVVILVFWGPVKLVLGLLWTGLKFLFSIILWIIKIPFNIIAWLLKEK